MFTLKGFVEGMRRVSGISLFVIPFGFAYGAAALQTGLSHFHAIMFSSLMFAGAAQFAILDLWSFPLPMLSIALVALAVNARHIIFGAVLAPLYNSLSLKDRILASLFLTDANFADMQAARQSGITDMSILFGGGFMIWVTWVLGTMLGVFVGGSADNLAAFGVDVVMAAYFVGIVSGSAKQLKNLLPMGVAALVAVVTLHILPNGWNVIAGALAGGVAGVFSER
jgi:4-azaleucine resistance transporter AzlC